MRITLYLIKKDESVIPCAKLVARKSSQLKIEILFAPYRLKDSHALLVGLQIYLYEILE